LTLIAVNYESKTNLSTPVPSVLAKLKAGNVLPVRYTQPRGPLQAITAKGEVAGSIITSKQVDIINCINEGYSFQAEIISISGAKCEVEITAV
jgi:hypothetical protein